MPTHVSDAQWRRSVMRPSEMAAAAPYRTGSAIPILKREFQNVAQATAFAACPPKNECMFQSPPGTSILLGSEFSTDGRSRARTAYVRLLMLLLACQAARHPHPASRSFRLSATIPAAMSAPRWAGAAGRSRDRPAQGSTHPTAW